MTKKEFLEKTKDFYFGALSEGSESFKSMPDGAYLKSLIDLAEAIIPDAGEIYGIKAPVEIDGYEIVMYFLTSGVGND